MQTIGSNVMVIVTILFTALCWGSYGPLLQWGHGDMGSGRLRPFICVGVAYFFVAIVGPLLLMMILGQETSAEKGLFSGWTFTGIMWSLAGGAAGALGAFGIILALNYGGSPTFVMPLVFGIAPVVNTFIMISVRRQWNDISPFFAAGLVLVAAGAVTVLLFAPKPVGKGHGKPVAKAVKQTPKESKPAEKDIGEGRDDAYKAPAGVSQAEAEEVPAVSPPQENE